VCREGYSYWYYGFGYFVCYADLLYDFTDGKSNYFADEKIKKIAEFQQKALIQGNVTASFSDGSIKSAFNLGLTHYLKSKFDISLIDEKYKSSYIRGECDDCYRYATAIRDFVWYNPDYKNAPADYNFYHLESSQWYINKKENYAFAAKGGDNDEPHNQNDVGCFVIAVNNEQLICDVGCGEYTKAYFRADTRYTFIVNSSRGHSVPIICGKEQSFGKEFKGEILSADPFGLKIQLAEAYDAKELDSLVRSFSFNDNEVILRDEFSFNSENADYIERFITKHEPKAADGAVIIENMEIRFDKALFDLKITREPYRNHNALDDALYTIDFTPTSNSMMAEFRFILS